jgi:hypothetical protein
MTCKTERPVVWPKTVKLIDGVVKAAKLNLPTACAGRFTPLPDSLFSGLVAAI